MKNFSRVIISIIAAITIFSATVFAQQKTRAIDFDQTIIFTENTNFSKEQKEIINDHITNGKNSQKRGIFCLFGHNYTSDYVTTISHRVKPGHPRCLSSYYKVFICTRCDDVKTEKITEIFITCCS